MRVYPSVSITDSSLVALIAADRRRARDRTGLGCWTVFLALGTLVSLGLGAYLVAEAVRYNHRAEAAQFLLLFGAGTVLLGAGTAAAWWKVRQARSTLEDAVVGRRAHVVWVYPKNTSVTVKDHYGGHQVGREQYVALVIAFADGTSVEVALESLIELAQAEAALTRWLPHAQHGYSPDLAQQYAAAPSSLRRA